MRVKRVARAYTPGREREDLRYWVKSDRSTAIRVLDLIEAVLPDPFQGPGKFEPLRYLLAGCWSRRITQEHRLAYRVGDAGAAEFLMLSSQCFVFG